MQRNRKAGQNPPRVVAPTEEEKNKNLFFSLRFYDGENIFSLRYKDQPQLYIVINISSYSGEVVHYCYPVLTKTGEFRAILVEKYLYPILRAFFQWE